MKNTKKIIGLATAVLTVAGLAACGGKSGSSKPAGSSKCSHSWVEVAEESVAATCTTEGKKVQKCSKCGEKKETKVSKAKHTYAVVEAESVAATCEAEGKKVEKCSVCGNVNTTTIDALGHDWVDDTDQSKAKQPTCTEAGEKLQHCSRCTATNSAEVEALGHDWDEDKWSKPATCEEKGVGTKECKRCKTVENIEADALGHKVELIGDDSEPEEGYAKVRTYSCTNEGCLNTYLGFKANEPTGESKKHLVIGEDGGARFWGRPIGNDVALSEDGSPDSNDHAPVYNKEQEGDFFEYKFKLTKEQADKLDNCRLFCDAQPAAYLAGKDFWANKEGDEDWTRGMYIDDDPSHYNEDGTAKEITDYRYVLYVDGKFQAFDPELKSPVEGRGGQEKRQEYVLPYTFKLHEGENTIRLVMAGGYRSTFYNFTFRAVEAKQEGGEQGGEETHTHAFNNVQEVTNETGKTVKLAACECGEKKMSIAFKDYDQISATPSGTNPWYLAKGSNLTWNLNMSEAVEAADVEFNLIASSPDHVNRHLYNEAIEDAKHEGEEGYVKQNTAGTPDKATEDAWRYSVAVGETDYPLTNTKTLGENGVKQNVLSPVTFTTVKLAKGNNVLKLSQNNIGYRMKFNGDINIYFKGNAKLVAHRHAFAGGEDAAVEGCSACKTGAACTCGAHATVIAASATTEGSLDGKGKLNKGTSGKYDGTNGVTYKFNAAAAGKARLMAKIWVDNAGNEKYAYTIGKNGGNSPVTLPDGKTNTALKINGADVAMPTATFAEMGVSGTSAAAAGICDFGEFDMVEGVNSFSLVALDSYGVCYGEFYIVF